MGLRLLKQINLNNLIALTILSKLGIVIPNEEGDKGNIIHNVL